MYGPEMLFLWNQNYIFCKGSLEHVSVNARSFFAGKDEKAMIACEGHRNPMQWKI